MNTIHSINSNGGEKIHPFAALIFLAIFFFFFFTIVHISYFIFIVSIPLSLSNNWLKYLNFKEIKQKKQINYDLHIFIFKTIIYIYIYIYVFIIYLYLLLYYITKFSHHFSLAVEPPPPPKKKKKTIFT